MEINFYEEFPTKENLEKISLIKQKTAIIIATKSIREIEKIKDGLKKEINIIYWPLINESYWISPFSNTKDLVDLFNKLSKYKGEIFIDLELPIKRKLIIKNIFLFHKNKKIISKFLKTNKKRIITGQYPLSTNSRLQKGLGLDYDIPTNKSLMWYSSMNNPKKNKEIMNNLKNIKNKKNYSISLGTIAKGILGNEPILSPEKLKEDLLYIKELGFKEVIIFRLGGLNKKYIKVINNFRE